MSACGIMLAPTMQARRNVENEDTEGTEDDTEKTEQVSVRMPKSFLERLKRLREEGYWRIRPSKAAMVRDIAYRGLQAAEDELQALTADHD